MPSGKRQDWRRLPGIVTGLRWPASSLPRLLGPLGRRSYERSPAERACRVLLLARSTLASRTETLSMAVRLALAPGQSLALVLPQELDTAHGGPALRGWPVVECA